MKQWLTKYANWKFIAPLIVLVLFFNLYLFPATSVKYQGKSLQPLDLKMSYTKNEIIDLFSKMKKDGRASYYTGTMIIDSIYPLVYTLLLILLFVFFIKLIGNNDSIFYFLLLFPIGIMLSDFAENMNTMYMLRSFPFIDEASANRGSFFSGLKWYLTIITICLLLFAIICRIILLVQKKYFSNKP